MPIFLSRRSDLDPVQFFRIRTGQTVPVSTNHSVIVIILVISAFALPSPLLTACGALLFVLCVHIKRRTVLLLALCVASQACIMAIRDYWYGPLIIGTDGSTIIILGLILIFFLFLTAGPCRHRTQDSECVDIHSLCSYCIQFFTFRFCSTNFHKWKIINILMPTTLWRSGLGLGSG
jgi:hypothetical protein